MNSPVIKDLGVLCTFLRRYPSIASSMKDLAKTPNREAHLVLSPPATLALAIQSLGHTQPDQPLRVLVNKTGEIDALDSGQWFRFTPYILDQPDRTIEVTLAGTRMSALKRSQATHCLAKRHEISVVTRQSVQQAFERQNEPFDLCIQFSKLEFGKPLGRLLTRLSENSVPFVYTSHSTLQALLHRHMLSCFGVSSDSPVSKNPFRLVSKEHFVNWNRVISIATPTSPDSIELNEDMSACTDLLAAAVLDCHWSGIEVDLDSIGKRMDRERINVINGYVVNQATREVEKDGESIGVLNSSWRDQLLAYEEGSELEARFLWAACVRGFIAADGIAPIANTVQ